MASQPHSAVAIFYANNLKRTGSRFNVSVATELVKVQLNGNRKMVSLCSLSPIPLLVEIAGNFIKYSFLLLPLNY
jgi:hypothetical protein